MSTTDVTGFDLLAGSKKAMERITLFLYANMWCNDKRKLLVIRTLLGTFVLSITRDVRILGTF